MVAHSAIDHTGIPGTGTGGAGTVLQVVVAVSTTKDDTTAATAQDSSLSATITPAANDSILIIDVSGVCTARRAAGTIAERYSILTLRNVTNSVDVAANQNRGRALIGTSAVEAVCYNPIAIRARYVVNSTTARTFRLQHHSPVVTNVESSIRGDLTGGVMMTITEVAV